MTRFTRDFPERVERDLSQISDQATPSSTAWEAIQHRIDEQDTTERTMEVIMLDPETNRLTKRPRTGMLVAASIAAVALVGGLVIVANRDGERAPADRPEPVPTVDATVPAIAGDAEPAVDENAPNTAPAPVVDPDVTPSTDIAAVPATVAETFPPVGPTPLGEFSGSCSNQPFTGLSVMPLPCTFQNPATLPFASQQNTTLTLLQIGTLRAQLFVGVSDEGSMTTGYIWNMTDRGNGQLEGGHARFVGVSEGTGEYEGTTINQAGRTLDRDDGETLGDWWIDNGPRPMNSEDPEVAAEVTFTCTTAVESAADPATLTQTCIYEGDDARFVPDPESLTVLLFPADFAVTPTGAGALEGADFFASTADSGAMRAGLSTNDNVVRWAGVQQGTGEFADMLIHEVAWGTTENPGTPEEVTTGVIQMTVTPYFI